jgi:hypothetical protein
MKLHTHMKKQVNLLNVLIHGILGKGLEDKRF